MRNSFEVRLRLRLIDLTFSRGPGNRRRSPRLLWRNGEGDKVKETVLGKEANIVDRKQINAGRATWRY